MFVDLVMCPTANMCLFNIKGEEGILARNVAVYIHGYNAPLAVGSYCRIEQYRGMRAL